MTGPPSTDLRERLIAAVEDGQSPHAATKRCGSTATRWRHAREQQGLDALRRRHRWFELQPDVEPERLVFVDETNASTKMMRLRGRARRGEPCRAPVPHGH